MGPWLTFGSIHRPLVASDFEHLKDKLGLRFEEVYDENAYMVGTRRPTPGDHGLSMWAVRHFDASPGLVIQVAWRDEQPSHETLLAVAREVEEVIETLPEPHSEEES